MILTKIKGFSIKKIKLTLFIGTAIAGTIAGLTNRTPSTATAHFASNPIEAMLPTDIETTSMTIKKIENVLMITYAIIDSDVIFEDATYSLNVLKSMQEGKAVKTLSGYFGRRYSTKFLLTLDLNKIKIEAEDNVINIKYDEEDLPIIASNIITEISPIEYDGSEALPFIRDLDDWIKTFAGNNGFHIKGWLDYKNGLDFIMNESIKKASDEIVKRMWKQLLAKTIKELQAEQLDLGDNVPEVFINTNAIKENKIAINGIPIEDLVARQTEDIVGQNIQLDNVTMTGLRVVDSTKAQYKEEGEKEVTVTGPVKRSEYIKEGLANTLVEDVKKTDDKGISIGD